MPGWYVYMVRCADVSLYTGITTDVTRRVDEHNNKPAAAAYTRSRRPVMLVYLEPCSSRSNAAHREAEIRTLSREQKEQLIKQGKKKRKMRGREAYLR